MAKSIIHGEKTRNYFPISPKQFILDTIEKLEKEFERILSQGFDKDSPFYEYLGDIKVAVHKLH